MRAEGVGIGGGYTPLNKQPFIEKALQSPLFQKVYTEKHLDDYRARNHCPVNDRLCTEACVIAHAALLSGTRSDMDKIAEAFRKVQRLSHMLT